MHGYAEAVCKTVEDRPTLCKWLAEYESIRRDYVASVAALGVDLAPPARREGRAGTALGRVLAKGAHARNAGASVWTGHLSPACEACATGLGSQTFVLSLNCNRDCYFCFNKNQVACSDDRLAFHESWRREVDEFALSVDGGVTHVGLTGGEPLLYRTQAVAFVRYVRQSFPAAHIRLYTAGDFLDDGCLADLRDAGLDELRLSVKLDVPVRDARAGFAGTESAAAVDEAVAVLARAQRFIPVVMVEMPVIPGTGEAMRRLLDRLDELGVFGVNLLEFGYPASDWAPFSQRGFRVKNPPYAVAYDYSYPAGLPIDGSEALCLELLEYALDRGFSLNVHYCSLENKNRGQVFRQNAVVDLSETVYALDGEDFFYKAAKVFDGDVQIVRARLDALGARYLLDEGGMAFEARLLGEVADLPVVPAISYNVVETTSEGSVLREVALTVALEGRGDALMGNKDEGLAAPAREPWGTLATAYELLALSFAYPDESLAAAVASGEWADAADEVARALGMELPEDWDRGLDAYSSEGEDAVLKRLRVEATRLLVGAPVPAVSPYEGVRRAVGEGVHPLLYVNPHSMDVERSMRACGVGRPAGTNDPIDRIDTELEFLEFLCLRAAGLPSGGGGHLAPDAAREAYGAFVADHVATWMASFAADAASNARESFYRSASLLLSSVVGHVSG